MLNPRRHEQPSLSQQQLEEVLSDYESKGHSQQKLFRFVEDLAQNNPDKFLVYDDRRHVNGKYLIQVSTIVVTKDHFRLKLTISYHQPSYGKAENDAVDSINLGEEWGDTLYTLDATSGDTAFHEGLELLPFTKQLAVLYLDQLLTILNDNKAQSILSAEQVVTTIQESRLELPPQTDIDEAPTLEVYLAAQNITENAN